MEKPLQPLVTREEVLKYVLAGTTGRSMEIIFVQFCHSDVVRLRQTEKYLEELLRENKIAAFCLVRLGKEEDSRDMLHYFDAKFTPAIVRNNRIRCLETNSDEAKLLTELKKGGKIKFSQRRRGKFCND